MSTQSDRDSPKAGPTRTGPVLVRGAFSLGPLVFLLCCGLVLVGVGVYDRALRPWDRTSFLYMVSAGAFWTALAAGVLLGRLWRRRWVEPTPTGFVLTDRGRSRTFTDEDVVGVTQSFRERSVPDIRHRVRLEVRGGRPVVIAYSVPQGKVDPLADLWARVVTGLARRVRAGLGEGASLAGRHWRLSKDGLLYRGEVFPLRSVTKVGYYSGRLCLWKGEDERPFARLPGPSRNVLPLGELLWEAAGGEAGHRPLASPLGRVLAERRGFDALLGIALVLALTFSCGLFLPGVVSQSWSLFIVGSAVVTTVLVLAATAHQLRLGLMPKVAFHEMGVAWQTSERVESLRDDEVETVVWVSSSALLLQLGRAGAKPALNFYAALVYASRDLAVFRDRICLRVARRWAGSVPHGPVRWTSRLRFLPGGLEYTPRSLLAKPHPVTVPYHLTSYRIESGIFLLFVVGEPGPVYKESSHGENFFVGLMLLRLIYDGREVTLS